MTKQNLLNTEQKELLKKFAGTASYYNASEGNWASESKKRNHFRQQATEMINSWLEQGLRLDEIESYYNEVRQLSRFTDVYIRSFKR
jgi:DNA-binding transcriptional regulator YhcF (GntR family)